MTAIAYTANYESQKQLRLAYSKLAHTSGGPTWPATLLIDEGLTMYWACKVVESWPGEYQPAPRIDWHVISKAGDLDYPPLKSEEEIWAALLAEHPVPTDPHAEEKAKFYASDGSVETMHREQLRAHYLGSAHIAGGKRNPTDVNFSPLVRDWDHSARELAAFIDNNRPPKLTAEQRVMEKGAELAELEAALQSTKTGLGRLMRNAARETQQPDGSLRPRLKADLHRWTGRSRPTVDAWLEPDGCCEGAVPEEFTADTHEEH